MTITNFKFAITSKQGHSVVIEFKNYDEAQKYAYRHFGKGCIVQFIGNKAPHSTNPVVQNALAHNKRAILNSIADSLENSLYGRPKKIVDEHEKQVHVVLECFDFTGKYKREIDTTLAKLLGVLSNIGKPGVYRDMANKLNRDGESTLRIDPKIEMVVTMK